MSTEERENERGCVALEERKTTRRRPRMWAVILVNDDYTTMDFVVQVLRSNFGHTLAEAENIMMTVHRTGRGLAGVYSRDIAETLAGRTMKEARAAGFPLRCETEPQELP